MIHRDPSRLLSPATPNAAISAPDPTSADRALDLERRTLVAICSAAVLLALIFGLHLLGPDFLEEHRRLRPWEVPAIWAGNAAGLLWFLRFLHRHFIAGEPFLDRPLRPFEPRPSALAITILTLAGVALDLCVSLYHVHSEHTGYAAAAQTTGQAYRVDRIDHDEWTNYHVHCRFTDPSGVGHTAHFRVAQHKDAALPPVAEATTAQSIAAGVAPFPVPVRYDPTFPARAWLDGAPFSLDEGNDLASFSVMVLCFQSFYLSIFLPLTIWATRRYARRGLRPWFHDLYKATPLTLEAGLMFAFGIATRGGM